MSDVRNIDLWFIEEVLPHEARYIAAAARMLGDAEVAADVVHDAYARLFSSDGWTAIDNPPAYVMRMVHNLVIARHRRSKIVQFRALSDTLEAQCIDPAPGPYDHVSDRERGEQVTLAIAAMPERCREVLVMRHFHGISTSEIARQLGTSLSTIEKRLARGLVLLADAPNMPLPKRGEPSHKARRKSS